MVLPLSMMILLFLGGCALGSSCQKRSGEAMEEAQYSDFQGNFNAVPSAGDADQGGSGWLVQCGV